MCQCPFIGYKGHSKAYKSSPDSSLSATSFSPTYFQQPLQQTSSTTLSYTAMPNFLRSKDSSSSLGSAVSSKTLASTTNSSIRPPPSYTSHSTVFSLAPSSTVVPSSRSSNSSLKSYSSSSTVRVKSPPPSNSATSKPAFSSSSFSPYLSHSNAHSTAQFAASTASFNLSPPVLPTYHPTSLNEKWHYTFKKGDQVWVNRNYSWRLGTVCEDGSEEIVEVSQLTSTPHWPFCLRVGKLTIVYVCRAVG